MRLLKETKIIHLHFLQFTKLSNDAKNTEADLNDAEEDFFEIN